MKKIQLGIFVMTLLVSIPVISQAQSLQGARNQAGTFQNLNAGKVKTSTEEAIISLEKRAWEAVKARDAKAFSDIFAADGMMADSMGFSSLSSFLQTLPDLKIDQYTLTDFKVMLVDKNSALITYKADVKGSFKGQAFPAHPAYISSLWTKRNGKWMAVYHQETLGQ